MRKDISGQHFGRLQAVRPHYDAKLRQTVWECQCSCGNKTNVRAHHLIAGNTKSCGCICKEFTHLQKWRTIHGKTNTRLHGIWRGMKNRCYNPKHRKYHYYGGRGISVCDEWRDNFMTFYNWSIAHSYRDDLTIDRIDNDGNYEPNNCRWATHKEQRANQRAKGKGRPPIATSNRC